MTEQLTKEKKWVPAVGQYNVEKAIDKISKGTKRSYKWVNFNLILINV